MKTIVFIVVLLCCSLLNASTPSTSLEKMNDTQKNGNKLLEQQNEQLKINLSLIKEALFLSISEIVFLLQQRNKLIFNDIKIESLQGE